MLGRVFKTPTMTVLLGQVTWAVSQAGVLFLVASTGRMDLVGLIAIGLSIFAPIALAVGFNLRNQIAIDHENRIDIRRALGIRAILSALALAFTTLCVFFVAGHLHDAVIAVLIVATRVTDQISDISTGEYQKRKDFFRIFRSLAVRGVANALPFFVLYYTTGDFVISAIASLLVTAIGVAMVDVLPLISFGNEHGNAPRSQSVFSAMGRGVITIPFPMLDSLHVNSLRYALAYFLTVDALGSVAIAQTLFVPVTMVISALGYSNLSRASLLVKKREWRLFRSNVWQGVKYSSAISCLFILVVATLPDQVSKFISPDNKETGREILIWTALAMAPLTIAGFPCQSLLSRKLHLSYTLNPIIGLVCFWVLLATAFRLFDQVSLLEICALFAISGILRSALAIWASLRGTTSLVGGT